MTARQFAQAMDVEYSTVMRWLKEGDVPNAHLEEPIPGLKVWQIPEAALQMPRRRAGRRKAAKAAKKGGAK